MVRCGGRIRGARAGGRKRTLLVAQKETEGTQPTQISVVRWYRLLRKRLESVQEEGKGGQIDINTYTAIACTPANNSRV